jgi:hypothetical protein
MGGQEAKAVVAIDLCYYGRYLMKSGLGERVEEAVTETKEVGREPVDAVRVDTTEVGEHESFGYNCSVFWGYAVPF